MRVPGDVLGGSRHPSRAEVAGAALAACSPAGPGFTVLTESTREVVMKAVKSTGMFVYPLIPGKLQPEGTRGSLNDAALEYLDAWAAKRGWKVTEVPRW